MKVEQVSAYQMHEVTQAVYDYAHQWLDELSEAKGYRDLRYGSSSGRALARENWIYSAFNFHIYFATHFFKARCVFDSDLTVGTDRLIVWLRHNPYLCLVDIGCGDGAASLALIDTLLNLREQGKLDPRPLQIACVGVDINEYALKLYEETMGRMAELCHDHGIELNGSVILSDIGDSSSRVSKRLANIRNEWKLPALNRTIMIQSNVTDMLHSQYNQTQPKVSLSTFERAPLGEELGNLASTLFNNGKIDQLYIATIDTEPDRIRTIVDEMRDSIETMLQYEGHLSGDSSLTEHTISFFNPAGGYFPSQRPYNAEPFVVSVCHMSSSALASDERWQQIATKDNLQLAWARARQHLLFDTFYDSVDIRLFEYALGDMLERLEEQLRAYAIHTGYLENPLPYNVPKNAAECRPRGLNWLEEEILIVAIIQVVGQDILRHSPSFAYRLSEENTPEREPTEYLYERWSDAWKDFRSETRSYVESNPAAAVFQTDISQFFNNIKQTHLTQLTNDTLHLSPRIQWLLELLVTKDLAGHQPGKGLIQGSVGSGFLANIFLADLDGLFARNDQYGRRLFRYVDDIVVVIPESAMTEVTRESVLNKISVLDLSINEKKTNTFTTEQFLEKMAEDEELDELSERYQAILAPLMYQISDETLCNLLQTASRNEESWWGFIRKYQRCLVELGIYIAPSRLSRKLATSLPCQVEESSLSIPYLPDGSDPQRFIDWAHQFRQQNLHWTEAFHKLIDDLRQLFSEAHEKIIEQGQDDISQLRRRLRFATNRLAVLGLSSDIANKLASIMQNTPWLLSNPLWLVEDLAAQGHKHIIWELIDFYESDDYLRAVTIRSIQFFPLGLELTEWQQLESHLFRLDRPLSTLMATETWLIHASRLSEVPFAQRIASQIESIFVDNARAKLIGRLEKNYILMMGLINPTYMSQLVGAPGINPMLRLAFDTALNGRVRDLFRSIEPQIIRQSYYSAQPPEIDDRSGY